MSERIKNFFKVLLSNDEVLSRLKTLCAHCDDVDLPMLILTNCILLYHKGKVFIKHNLFIESSS